MTENELNIIRAKEVLGLSMMANGETNYNHSVESRDVGNHTDSYEEQRSISDVIDNDPGHPIVCLEQEIERYIEKQTEIEGGETSAFEIMIYMHQIIRTALEIGKERIKQIER